MAGVGPPGAGFAAGLDLGLGPGPTGAPAGQVQGPGPGGAWPGAGLHGGGQGGGMGGEALQQLLAQPWVLAAEGVKSIGAGGLGREALQQLPPEVVGPGWLVQGLGRQRLVLEHDCSQGVRAPALTGQQLGLPLGIRRRFGLALQQQAGLTPLPGIGRPAPEALQGRGRGGWSERRQAGQQRPPAQQGDAGAEAGDGQQQGEARQRLLVRTIGEHSGHCPAPSRCLCRSCRSA